MLVSIVTVCYNEQSRIRETLLSIIEQTHEPIELIVIDGGSNDGTLDILRQFEDRITTLVSGEDNGIYDAMNIGIQLARGEYVIFMNGGDKFYSKNTLSDLFMDDTVAEDIIYGDVAAVFPDGSTRISKSPDKLSLGFLVNYNISHQITLYRRDLLEEKGGFSLKHSILSDYEFLVSSVLCDKRSTRHIDQVISYFYKDGISARDDTKLTRQRERVAIQKDLLPSVIYIFTNIRFWLINNLSNVLPKWCRDFGNKCFHFLFKPNNF